MKTIFTILIYTNAIVALLYATAKITEWLIEELKILQYKTKKIRKEDK